MKRLREEIRFLTTKLTKSHPVPDSTEEMALALLRHLERAANSVQDARRLDRHIRTLEDYWLHHVPWCSVLSKDIERIIIFYEDVAAGGWPEATSGGGG